MPPGGSMVGGRSPLRTAARRGYDDPRDRNVTMDPHTIDAQKFGELRPQLRGVAYRMLGSISEAEDAVQEAWLRLSRSDRDAIANLGGWLTTVVARIALDMLRARRARREDYVGSWLPEPIVNSDVQLDPEQETLLADSV